MDDVVGEVELHFVQREIRERNLLRVNDVAVAIVAEDGCAAVGANLQLPDLELFLSNAGFMLLSDCDDVEQPVGAALLGKELSAVGVEHRAIDPVAIPVFRAGELPELRFGECSCVRHVVPLSLKCPPRRGRGQAQCSRDKRGSHSFLGEPRQRRGGAKTASLTASNGATVTAPRQRNGT